MKKYRNVFKTFSSSGILILGWTLLLMTAYGRLLFHPDLHTACPENDTWNLPIRWSVLSALRGGHLPLWNPLSAFGIPWLATWQTETFYPGTVLFKWFGLAAWNYSGILHLMIFSTGFFYFLKSSGVSAFWSFFCAAVSLLNGCAYNHLGSNSSMDTMAWMPWIFVAIQQTVGRKPWGALKLAFLLMLQVFSGYPQIIFYTLIGGIAYAIFLKGWRSLMFLILPIAGGLFLSACQWIPSIEYFFLLCVRLPAVTANPHFFLPSENLLTFLDFNALWKNGTPDYVLSPTFFYFNFYSGFIPLGVLLFGLLRFHKLNPSSRFFLNGFLLLILWTLGVFLKLFEWAHIPFPAFLEPAKCWVLINVFELAAVGLLLQGFFPKPGKWKWAVLAIGVLNLLVPLWNHPLERNLIPPNQQLETEAQKIKSQLGSGRVLILPGEKEHATIYTPLPDPEKRAIFKRFAPNSNLFSSIPVPTFYGSTWPTWGSLDAARYFQIGFPFSSGNLMDALGIDLLYLPETKMPSRYKKIQSDGAWTLWKNPTSVGDGFFFRRRPQAADRKEAFEAFASGVAKPLQNLFLDSKPSYLQTDRSCDFDQPPPGKIFFPNGKKGFWVVTQNAMPGWRAWVDGAPSPIVLADGFFQCVPVPAGTKWVKLAYEPASFRFGLFISLLTCAVLFCLGGLRRLDLN